MEFFPPGLYLDVMKYRTPLVIASVVAIALSVLGFFWPGPNWGTDFRGGTELEVAFHDRVTVAELRSKMTELGYRENDVVSVQGRPNQYIIRVATVSALSKGQQQRIRERLRSSLEGARVQELKFSPGGDKVSMQLSADADADTIQHALEAAGVRVRDVSAFGRAGDHRYEASLFGVADEILRGLRSKLGNKAPDQPLRVEWVGPKAGAQLRDAAIKSLLYAIAFIMVYVAFRFDLRFAPGGVVALIHDAIFTCGILILLQKELTLSTVAALLTIVGYSINDTIVVYDRIRENMQRMRDKSLRELINISTSQTLGRTIMTSLTTLISISAFFFLGTAVIRDFALTLFIGITIGTYSSIYIAAPITEFMDRRFFGGKSIKRATAARER
jgi:preprotein translocase subunit SecF